jgi:hypothetical protein
LRLVASQGGASKALVRRVDPVFGWSPDGKRIAFERGQRALEIVYVGTGKVLRLPFGSVPSVAWSSNSQELLVRTPPKHSGGCASLWRVPIGGDKPQLLRNC